MNTSPAVLVIGLGNTLRGDDAFGPLAARRVETLVDSRRVRVLERPALTPELAAEVAQAKLVLFLDASTDGEPGEIVCRDLTAATSPQPFTHGLAPAALLDLAKQLFGQAPAGYLFTTRGISFELRDGELSPVVQAALQPLAERVVDCLGAKGD